MEQNFLWQPKVFNCKTPIAVLSIVSFVFQFGAFIVYEWQYWKYADVIDILSPILSLIPPILLVMYIFTHQLLKVKTNILMAVIWGIPAFLNLFWFLYDAFRWGNIAFGILYIPLIVINFLCVYSALKGFPNKLFYIIVVCLRLLFEILFLPHSVGLPSFLFSFVSIVTLYIALLLFGVKNRHLTLSPDMLEKQNAKHLTPEQSLNLLQEKLELGIITEEEYQAQRTDIISKL